MMCCRRHKTAYEVVSAFLSFLILFFHTDSVSMRTWTQINHRCQIHLPPIGPIRSQIEDTPQTLGQTNHIQWDSFVLFAGMERVSSCGCLRLYVGNELSGQRRRPDANTQRSSDMWSQQWRSKIILPHKNGQKVMSHNLLCTHHMTAE